MKGKHPFCSKVPEKLSKVGYPNSMKNILWSPGSAAPMAGAGSRGEVLRKKLTSIILSKSLINYIDYIMPPCNPKT